MKRLLTHPWLTIRVQLALGAIFVIAALPKIADPPSFAHMIYNYRLVPSTLMIITRWTAGAAGSVEERMPAHPVRVAIAPRLARVTATDVFIFELHMIRNESVSVEAAPSNVGRAFGKFVDRLREDTAGTGQRLTAQPESILTHF